MKQRNKQRKWTNEDLAMLHFMYTYQKVNVLAIAKYFGVADTAIRFQASNNGFSR